MANLITLARFPALIGVILLLYSASPLARFLAVPLLLLLIALDTVDGLVARARHETSLLGSVLDVMTDRAVELVLWVCYADLGLVPVAIPLIVILRGTVVDSLRSLVVSAGQAPFKGMRSPVGAWLVGSPVMRTGYGLAKFVAFTGLAAVHALSLRLAVGGSVISPAATTVRATTLAQLLWACQVASWVAVALCLLRGLPVIAEALAFRGFSRAEPAASAAVQDRRQ